MVVNQPLSRQELITFARQILQRLETFRVTGYNNLDVISLAMGKHVDWLGLDQYCTFQDVIDKAEEIVDSVRYRL